MLTIKEVLSDKVALDIACIDRVYLNGYVKYLQMPGGLITFIREQMNWPVPGPQALQKKSNAFRAAVERFAADQGLEIITFAKGSDKDAIARAQLAHFTRPSGVVLIGKAQEKALGYKCRRADHGTKVWFEYSRQSVCVIHYYFYILDPEFGLFFIKVCTYMPFEVKVCFNGHEWAKQQLRKEGIAFEPLSNGFLSCANPTRLQDLCHQLNAARVQALFDRWVDQLPWPLSPAERAAGYGHQLSVWQLEVCRTQVFLDPEQGRALVESLIRDNLDLGRPDRVSLLFERRVTKRTPSEFHTRVVREGVLPTIRIRYKHSALKQYLKDSRALRTEMMINNAQDFDLNRGLSNLDRLVALGHRVNRRLLELECLSQDCFPPLDTVRHLGQSTLTPEGQRASALHFGEQRVMAVLAALARLAYVPQAIRNGTLRPAVAQLLGVPLAEYGSAQMTYDLRRLRLKGLLQREPHSHRYTLTDLGAKVVTFFTKLYERLFRPGWAALVPGQRYPSNLAKALNKVAKVLHSMTDEALFAPATTAA